MSVRKPTPPHCKKPDVDKLSRSTLDAIGSAGIWRDDCDVIELRASKRTAEPNEITGCWIHLEDA